MKRYNYIITAILIIWALISCEEAREDVYTTLPDIEIKTINSGDVLPSYFYQGETLRLTPVVKYGDAGNEVFDFRWYRQYTDSLSLISESPTLEYVLDDLGSITIRMEAINKETLVSAGLSFSITVTGRSELGWYILKENAEGNTDVDLFRMTTSGEIDGLNEDLLKQRDCVLKGSPKNFLYSYNYSWLAPGASYLTSGISTLIPVSEKGMASLRLSDVKVMESGEDLFYDNMDHIDNLEGGAYETNQVVLLNNGRVHLMSHGMSGFLSEMPGTYHLSPWMTTSEADGARLICFDETTRSFAHIAVQASSLSYFPDEYMNEKYQISSNGMNGSISFMENTNGNLNPDTTYTQKAYAMFHENDRNDRFILFGLDLTQIDPNQNDYGSWQYSPIMWSDTISYNTMPDIKGATAMTLHKDFSILYYAKGNQINSYDIESRNHKESILSYTPGEEITFMHFIVCDYASSVSFRNLIVATYNVASNVYKIYRYSIAGNDIKQVGDTLTGMGKVKTVVFASPNSETWQDYSFCYF